MTIQTAPREPSATRHRAAKPTASLAQRRAAACAGEQRMTGVYREALNGGLSAGGEWRIENARRR